MSCTIAFLWIRITSYNVCYTKLLRDQQFTELKPKVEKIVELQRALTNKLLAEAKQKLKSNDKKELEEGALLLFRSYKGLPRNKALIT